MSGLREQAVELVSDHPRFTVRVDQETASGRLDEKRGTLGSLVEIRFFGGIRHLVWDTVHGFELRTIYMSGWTVGVASIVMTAVAWIASAYIGS